eukprot:scaffold3026_cov55-Phaeocystis_antarctica.AAC.1
MTGFGTAFAVCQGADIAVRREKNRTVMHGDDTSLVWFRGIATSIRLRLRSLKRSGEGAAARSVVFLFSDSDFGV